MSSKEEARKVVLDIAKRHPFVSQDILDQLDPEQQRILEESWSSLESATSHPVTLLAKQLYDNDARFLFELLQNADDNSFEVAKARGGTPYIAFKVYPDRIIVECNEDGFTKEDLEALCDVGGSSRTSWHGYTGAKGIGLKSVFTVAHKISIQSGHFSFSFAHEKGRSGIGMIRPIWDETDEVLNGPLTRMTLYLRKPEDSNELDDLKSMISKQFTELQETCMIFLRNIKHISVELFDADGDVESSNSFQVSETGPNQICLAASETTDGEAKTKTSYYHVTRYTANNLAVGNNRIQSQPNIKRRCPNAEVILGFPLTADSSPILEVQKLFNFLPIKESCYEFIICTDFDIDEDGQDIVPTSERNVNLQEAIAVAFVNAVLQFCDDPRKIYLWPQYLPNLDVECGSFWSSLNEMIKQRIKTTPVLMPEYGTELGIFNNLRLPYLDENGDPIFHYYNTISKCISSKYSARQRRAFQQYGMGAQSYNSFVEMLRADLTSPHSKMRNESTSETWHSLFAETLLKLFDMPTSFVYDLAIEELRKLPLLPLRDGQWVCPADGIIYMPFNDGVSLPPSLGAELRVLEPKAAANPDRKLLFQKLGARELSAEQVRSHISASYGVSDQITIANSVADLRYLYLTHHLSDTVPGNISVFNEEMECVDPAKTSIYQSGDDKSGPRKLLQLAFGENLEDVNYLHPSYFADHPINSHDTVPSWENWLHQYLGIFKRLRLVDRDGIKLSQHAIWIKRHRPQKFLALIELDWKSDDSELKKHQTVQNEIQNLRTQSLCSSKSDDWLLQDTWLPLPHLKETARQYMYGDAIFPFLILEDNINESSKTKWEFLHDAFGVGTKDDLNFYLRILIELDSDDDQTFSNEFGLSVCSLYRKIYDKIEEEGKNESNIGYLREVFSCGCVLVPDLSEDKVIWANPKDCLWEAPSGMISKYSLQQMYESMSSEENMGFLTFLFRDILEIRDVTWGDVVDELKALKEFGYEEFDLPRQLYGYLSASTNSCSTDLRAAFDNQSLIFAEKNGERGWYKSSECAWSGAADEQDQVILDNHYDQPEQSLFVDSLGVTPTSFRGILRKLHQTDAQTSIEDLKKNIWELNEHVYHRDGRSELASLSKAKIFPVKNPNGQVVLESIDCEFAIGDRKHLLEMFSGRVKLLDYTLDEVRKLEPVFQELLLSSRFLSNSVTTIRNEAVSPVFVESKTSEMRQKAYAMFRIAATFQGYIYRSDPYGLYQKLHGVKVYQAESISSERVLYQDGRTFCAARSPDLAALKSTKEGFVFNVPQDREAQEFAFNCTIPEKLGRWMTRRNSSQRPPEYLARKATAVLSALISCDISNIERVLDSFGIIVVPSTEIKMNVTEPGSIKSLPPKDAPSTYPSRVAELRIQLPEYKEDPSLFDRVLKASRQATFPINGSFNMHALRASLVTNNQSESDVSSYDGVNIGPIFRSTKQYERDRAIGVAGELYVFEVLSRLGLTGWSDTNWKVMNRDEQGKLLPIIYQDSEGDLTNILLRNGYVDGASWRQARPKYYIDVKATTGPYSTPFNMSRTHYERMRHAYHSASLTEVYIVVRVFSIGSEDCGMSVQVDPETLKPENSFFTLSHWVINPKKVDLPREQKDRRGIDATE